MPVPHPLVVAATVLLLLPVAASAADPQPTARQEARLEGALQTALALNRLLNPFKIEVEV